MYERYMKEVVPDLTTILNIYMTFLKSCEAEKKNSNYVIKSKFLLIILGENLYYLSILCIKDVFT